MSRGVYRIEFVPSAFKAFEALPRDLQRRLGSKIDALGRDPRPRGAKKLQGETRYRIRLADYRVVYEVRDDVLLVLVIRIAHRREVYRGL